MSAFDPKRTSAANFCCDAPSPFDELADAGERLVDYAAWETGRLRAAHHGGKEDVKVATTLRRPRWCSEEEDQEQCGKRA